MQVFISYKREDESFAREIHAYLLQAGHIPWLDVLDIKPAIDWDTAIHNGLRNSEAVIGVITPESLESKNVLDEWGYALTNGKHLILLWLRNVDEADIPPRYGRMQRIDLRSNKIEGFERIKQALLDLGKLEEFAYTLLSHDEVSHGSAKRYRAEVLTESKYSKADIREVIKRVTDELRQSRYYKSAASQQRYGDRDADAVFLFIYTDIRDKQFSNWVCKAQWLTANYPSSVKPHSGQVDEILNGIEIHWKPDYQSMKKYWSEQVGKKEDWIATIETFLPKMESLVEEGQSYLKQYEEEKISEEAFDNQMTRMEDVTLNVYLEIGNQKRPPPECSECDQEFQNMSAQFHNIFVPFASWGQAKRNWDNKLWLMRDYLTRYHENKQSFEHIWSKIRR